MSYGNAAVLQFPSNYVLMSEEEMTYVNGGYSFLCDENYSDVRTDTKKISATQFNRIAAVYAGCAATATVAAEILTGCGFPISAVAATIVAGICGMIAAANAYAGTYNALQISVRSCGHYTTSGRTALSHSYKFI